LLAACWAVVERASRRGGITGHRPPRRIRSVRDANRRCYDTVGARDEHKEPRSAPAEGRTKSNCSFRSFRSFAPEPRSHTHTHHTRTYRLTMISIYGVSAASRLRVQMPGYLALPKMAASSFAGTNENHHSSSSKFPPTPDLRPHPTPSFAGYRSQRSAPRIPRLQASTPSCSTLQHARPGPR